MLLMSDYVDRRVEDHTAGKQYKGWGNRPGRNCGEGRGSCQDMISCRTMS